MVDVGPGGLGGVLYDARKRKVVMRSGIDGEGRPEWRPAGLVDPDHRYWLLRRPGDSALLDLDWLKSQRTALLAAPRDDFTRWGLWFLGDRDNRESWPAVQVAEP